MRVGDDFREWILGAEAHGQRLDVVLAARLGLSRSALRARFSAGVVLLDGRPGRWGERLRAGAVLRVPRLARPEPEVEVRYRLLAQDDWLVAVDKGPGAPVHPSRSFRTRTVLSKLRAELGDAALRPAHRLDRETSGVLLFGRTALAASRLGEQFARHTAQKRYLAVVRGAPAFTRRVVELPLGRDPDFPVRCRMRVDERGGQPARTELEVLARLADRALVAAVPRTGRQHQIRVHLAALGHPLLGDKLYQEGGRPYLDQIGDRLGAESLARLGHTRQALHAERLAFTHPGTGERLTLTAPLPEDLEQLLG
ncbi:MAG TPA: RluA family pseudouridine synthase [Myxococcota bacterium]|nr:RluA family pseudouridine synthase [Myxococcota bacterium]HRY93214.1 RluA family pseudouridine synthase [Myxococcota bacterium]HSA22288.1 RluA family pseudouridine synthase [Myxococcota bacterium]